MMNAAEFSNALGKVQDRYIMEAITYTCKKKKDRLRWSAMAACFGLLLAATMITLPGILRGQGNMEPAPAPNESNAAVRKEDNPPGGEPIQSSSEPKLRINWDNVVVNESAGMATDAALRNYDPDRYVAETWGEEEIVAYYGWDLVPTYIPDGLSAGDQRVAAGIWREKATGEIVQEQTARSFWTDFWEDGSPKSDDDIVIPTGFTVIASKLGILHCCLLPEEDCKSTDFDGVPVTLSHCSLPYGPFDPTQKAPNGLYNMPAGYYDIYTASFTLDEVEYEIEAQRLELEEVIKIVASVIRKSSNQDFTVGNP